jgi:SRSO17 transposase
VNLPASASKKEIVGALKARWACEQAHQQMKEELGLDHFEGRSWLGLHHHAVLTMIAFGFLQQLRLTENKSAA